MIQDLELPIGFRSEIIEPVFAALKAGVSCSLVGVGSSGKSNVARHLVRLDVRRRYLGDYASNVLTAYVDCQKLSEYSIQSLHSQILESLPRAVQSTRPNAEDLVSQLESLWRQCVGDSSPDRVRRTLEVAIANTLRAGIAQIFIILDDFDPVVGNAPSRVLNSLRALRDDYKLKLVYVTITRKELAFLRNQGEYEDFYEIATEKLIAIGPYREEDATFMIDRLCNRWGFAQRLSDEEIRRLLEVSGCHAGLLKAILWAARQDASLNLAAPDLVERLRGHKDVEPECEKIWESLERAEIADLSALVSRGWPLGAGVQPLLKKGLIRERLDGTYDVFTPLFAEFIWDNLPDGRFAIKLIPDRREARIHDRVIKNFHPVGFELLSALYRQRPAPVSRRDLFERMADAERGGHRLPGPTEQRLAGYLAEVKRKIDTEQQEYVLLEPDGSYRLIGPDGK